ncbi:hypothetical protein AXF42_Ash000849 [Apostasia shenzhenica]|uniref:Uncharacterized protein n=1 Tax=Apostasia shenzhenica TaxID=1088818 RepID=A0A2I0ATC5_9ASPA|nr:hypothetical protein AXF42_Ash000849 [Apostasia shenzhenica]
MASTSQVLRTEQEMYHPEQQTSKRWRRKAASRTDLRLAANKDHPAFKRHGLSRRQTVPSVRRTATSRE